MGAHASHPERERDPPLPTDAPRKPQPRRAHQAPAKALVECAHREEGVSAITERSFTHHLLPAHPHLGAGLFRYLLAHASPGSSHLSPQAFEKGCERLLGIVDEAALTEAYAEVFSDPDGKDTISPERARLMLKTCRDVTTGRSAEGPSIEEVLAAVIESCFRNRIAMSPSGVAKWFGENAPKLIVPMHRYCAFVLSTPPRPITAKDDDQDVEVPADVLLTLDRVWLISGSLSPMFNATMKIPGSSLFPSMSFRTMLYDSREHGVGANRFLHHVLAYKGPTLVLVQGGSIDEAKADDKPLFCIASPTEWRETHLYTGGPESTLLRIRPRYCILENAPKMLYLNTHIRGYPKGLRAGSDPKEPIIAIDEGFEKFEYRGLSYPIIAMEVWGCGDSTSRETQLDIKKWQVKEAERQRQVKLSAADWIDHPDRYLLELAGRPQYNNSAS